MAALHLWMNGRPVGVWSTLRGGTPLLRYEASWAAAEEGRALSLSLPFTAGLEHRGEVVARYFDNLLPDSVDIRRRLGRRFRTRSTEAFDLLSAIGRDCVGALQLLPPEVEPQGWNRVEAEPLTAAGVESILRGVTADPVLGQAGDDDDFRISLAGAQEKTALLRIGTRWWRPQGATPTTHILKLPLGLVGAMRADMGDSVENEWLSGRLMAALGFAVAPAEMARFGETRALVVTRFDRRWQGVVSGAESKARFRPPPEAWIARLPQEDGCQALGIGPARKYQSDGGPSMQDMLGLLAQSETAAEDRATFALAQLAFWLLASTDGHAKNFSIAHRRGGRYGLAPLYDVLSAWPLIGAGPNRLAYARAKLAMAVRGGRDLHYRLRDIQARHWRRLAETSGPDTWPRMLALVDQVEPVLAAVGRTLPEGFPARVWEPIAAGMRRHANVFLRAVAAAPA